MITKQIVSFQLWCQVKSSLRIKVIEG